jgi:formylglycine-generating enzyme
MSHSHPHGPSDAQRNLWCVWPLLISVFAIIAVGGCAENTTSTDVAGSKTPDVKPLEPTSPETADSETGLPVAVKEPGKTPPGTAWVPGGKFRMGDSRGAPDKNPEYRDVIPEHNDAAYEHDVELDGFWIDKTEVTNRQFKAFVDATGYVTTAEKQIDVRKLYAQKGETLPKGEAPMKRPCSFCYNRNLDPSKVDKSKQLNPGWIYDSKIWKFVDDANWKQPEGPGSSIKNRMDHPVVHVSYDDALAYCKWAGKQLPTEAQWEYAARGGLKGKAYPWGDELRPGGKWYANIWQGVFPKENKVEDGYRFTAPVGKFPANGYGLYDMAGNVWEWCADWYTPDYYLHSPRRNPTGPEKSFDPGEPDVPKRVQRGGSFMCSDNYCIGYTVAARMKGEPEAGSFHLGFRCVVPHDKLDVYLKAPARKWERKHGR